MTLIEKIKQDQVAARRARVSMPVFDFDLNVRASLLTTLIGEAEAVGKNKGRAPTDEEVVAVVKKFIKGAEETLQAMHQKDGAASNPLGEPATMIGAEMLLTISILSEYLPKQMSTEEIEAFFDACKAGPWKTMGAAMAKLKADKPGQYDGKLAAVIAKRYF